MKRYIIPATESVALQMNSNLLKLSNYEEVTDPIEYPQLAPSGGWRSENWADYGDGEE